MEMIEKVATKIWNSIGKEFYTDDSCPDEVIELGDIDNIIFIGENYRDQQWMCSMSVNGTFEQITNTVNSLFSNTATTFMRDDGVKVNNWNVDGVLIVHSHDRIELFHNYQKVGCM